MFASIEEALEVVRRGGMVLVVDDEDRENEGDLIAAAEFATPAVINFMASHGRGLVCVPLTEDRCRKLHLQPMVQENRDPMGTAFTVSVDGPEATTGISAHERAASVQALIDPETTPDALRRPGHIFPLIAKDGGVLTRAGHTEAAVDLARLAGCQPAGVICEVMNDDGTMARLPQLEAFAEKHDLLIVTIKDLIAYRTAHERLIERVAAPKLPTKWGDFYAYGYRSAIDGKVHAALVCGDIGDGDDVLVRVHSQCLTGDVFHSQRCDCGEQLAKAMETIAAEGRGVLLYMMQEGRGIGLGAKLKAYELQEQGRDTVDANLELGFPADMRDYGIGAQILRDLGVRTMRLMTNNPRKLVGLEGHGLSVTDRIPVNVRPNDNNAIYLSTKVQRMGHLL